MKLKQISIIILMSSLSSVANAQKISEQQAYETAMQFLAGNRADQSMAPMRDGKPTLKMAYTARTGRKNDLYVFNRDEGGFVIVSADARTVKPVLGYSDNGHFDADNIPPALQYILSGYQEQIDYARANMAPQRGTLQSVDPKGTPVVGPLVKTMWYQDDPYNRLCPRVDAGESYTGCAATAMAQIMNYWRWPERGTGSHTNTFADSLFVDFSQSVYDWDNMAITYKPNTPQVKIDAVSRLMYDCGISVNMMYSYRTGAASGIFIAPALVNYFNYSGDARSICRNDYETQWDSIMMAELDALRPILTTGGEHAYICDGYDSEHYFHYNIGWGGVRDGYYLSNAINLENSDISFSHDQDAIIGIHPDYNDEYREGSPVCYIEADGNAVLYDLIRYRDSTDIIIPDSVLISDKAYPIKSIEKEAFFYRLNGCKNIILSETLENIGNAAFACSFDLSSLHIPASVKKIGNAAFGGAGKIKSITVDESNSYYFAPQGTNVLMEIGTGYLVRACNNSVIPVEDVITVGENACDYVDSLRVISFPNVTTVENDAFSYCINLSSITFGAGLTAIGERAFQGCYNLKDIYLYSDAAPVIFGSSIPVPCTIHVKASALDSYSDDVWSAYTIVADIEDATAVPSTPQTPAANQGTRYYDLLGRPVPPGYRGFVIKQ